MECKEQKNFNDVETCLIDSLQVWMAATCIDHSFYTSSSHSLFLLYFIHSFCSLSLALLSLSAFAFRWLSLFTNDFQSRTWKKSRACRRGKAITEKCCMLFFSFCRVFGEERNRKCKITDEKKKNKPCCAWFHNFWTLWSSMYFGNPCNL